MTTGFPGRNRPMPKLVAVLAVVFLALQIPAPSTSEPPNGRRDMSESKQHKLTIDLIPYHNLKSTEPDLTLLQRVEIFVKSSRERAKFIASKLSGKAVTFAKEAEVFSWPLFLGFYVEISLGTPPETQIVLADTGSDLAWVKCATSSQPDYFFNPKNSSSYSTVPCTDPQCASIADKNTPCVANGICVFSYEYVDSNGTTIEGDLSTETFTFNAINGSIASFPDFKFGCSTDQNEDFESIEGVVGLGQGNLSLMSQLGEHIDDVFSYCLAGIIENRTSSLLLGSAGNITLGYTPLVANTLNPSFYYVNLLGITIQGTPVKFPPDSFTINSKGEGGLILDSTTIFTMFNYDVWNTLAVALDALITYPLADTGGDDYFYYCYNISGVENPEFPEVVMQFEDVDLPLPTGNVFVPIDEVDSVCQTFLGFDDDTNVNIYGSLQQQNFQIAFDRENAQVGFASTTC